MNAQKPGSLQSHRNSLKQSIQGVSIASAAALMIWGWSNSTVTTVTKVASAASKSTKKTPAKDAVSPSQVSPQTQSRTVKLNYFSTPWEKVLKDVAEDTGSQLIADRVPSGRFSRRDATEYTRHDAVRIINKEIEPLGFRLIEKGDFLVVLDLPSQRPRYQPAVVSNENGTGKVVDPNLQSNALPAKSPFERRVESIRPREPQQSEPNLDDVRREVIEQQNAQSEATKPRTATTRSTGRSVRQVSHEDELNLEEQPVRKPMQKREAPRAEVESRDDSVPARIDVETVARPAKVMSGDPVVFQPKKRAAVDLSKQLYRSFKPHAQLVTHGRDGLPAFKISSPGPSQAEAGRSEGVAGRGPSFTVAIDEANDELLIEGSAAETAAVVKLLRALDRSFDMDETVQVASSSKSVCQIAAQLPGEIEKLKAAQKEVDQFAKRPVDQRQWGDDDEFAQAPRGDLREGSQKVARVPAGALGDVFSNLKGQVEIQSMPDLNAIMLKGAKEDVDQVMKVIRDLEKLSEATAPKVHVLYLKNVEAESLAELLTTVYEKLTKFPALATQPRQSAAILPVNKPNALMIVAPEADLNSIIDLAEELDKPVDPLTEFQVFHLQTAVALQVEEIITEFYAERKNLGAKVLAIAEPRSNSIVVRASARELDEVGTLIRKLDRDETASVSQMRIFPLKNAVATELAAVLNAAIQSVIAPPESAPSGGGQNGQLQGLPRAQVDETLTKVKSTMLQLIGVGKDGEKSLKSGILADIRVTPDARANSLIVTASETSMTLIAELVKSLDKPTQTVSEIKVFTLANADAELMVEQLNALFNNGTQGQGNRQQGAGIALAGADDASSSLVPLKFSIDKRTNSIIAAGAPDALRVVEAILLRLDESDLRARQTLVLRLQNSPATQVATEINQFYSSQRDLTQNDPNLLSSVEQLERDVVVVADTATNSLIVSATPRYFEDIRKMVEKLDEAPRQVIIQALLVEVELANTDEFGVELGFQDSILFNRSALDQPVVQTVTTTQNNTQTTSQVILSQTGQPGFNFNNPSLPLGNNLKGTGTRSSTVAPQALSNFSLGRVNGDLGFGGLVLSAGSESVNVLLRALSAHRKIQILSRPQIRALDNQQAEIFSGQSIPVVTGFTPQGTAGVNVPTVTPRDVGIQLICVPRVTSEGQVFMQLSAQRSQYRNEGVPLSTDTTGRTIESPILDISRANTTISVQTGQTVVIGGLINTRDEAFTNKVPFLADIPLIGTAFRYDSRTTRRVELLVFLTPRVVGGPIDEETIKEVEMGRLHFIESEAEEVHGPLHALPGEGQIFDDNGAPWIGPEVPASPAPDSETPSNTQIPPSPEGNGGSGPNVIRDSAVSPAAASRLRYTEDDSSPMTVEQAGFQTSSKKKPSSKSNAKSGKPASRFFMPGMKN